MNVLSRSWTRIATPEEADAPIRNDDLTLDIRAMATHGAVSGKIAPDGMIGETFLEWLVHGAVHFVETKQHLDEKGLTLCTGSRDASGDVPGVVWDLDYRRADVYWYDVGRTPPGAGLRRVVYA